MINFHYIMDKMGRKQSKLKLMEVKIATKIFVSGSGKIWKVFRLDLEEAYR